MQLLLRSQCKERETIPKLIKTRHSRISLVVALQTKMFKDLGNKQCLTIIVIAMYDNYPFSLRCTYKNASLRFYFRNNALKLNLSPRARPRIQCAQNTPSQDFTMPLKPQSFPFLANIRSFLRNISSSPQKLALSFVVILVFWLFVVGEHKRSESDAPEASPNAANSVNSVQILTSVAEQWTQDIVVQGQLIPMRRITLKSEVSGRILSLKKNQGEPVNQGEQLLTISDEGRKADLNQAQADVEYNTLELESAAELKKAKFVSASDISRFQAALAEAEAKLEKAQLAYDYGKPVAPFSGLIDRRHIETGDQIKPGDALFDIVQIDKLRVTAFVSQQKVSSLVEGQSITLTLLDGSELQGTLDFISAAADEATRSYYIEVSVDNPERRRIAGASVTLNIPSKIKMAHRISPALLRLNKNGKPGVYAVADDNTVVYYPVDILSVGNQAIVSGLPESARLISLGAGFVKVGQHVQVSEQEG